MKGPLIIGAGWLLGLLGLAAVIGVFFFGVAAWKQADVSPSCADHGGWATSAVKGGKRTDAAGYITESQDGQFVVGHREDLYVACKDGSTVKLG